MKIKRIKNTIMTRGGAWFPLSVAHMKKRTPSQWYTTTSPSLTTSAYNTGPGRRCYELEDDEGVRDIPFLLDKDRMRACHRYSAFGNSCRTCFRQFENPRNENNSKNAGSCRKRSSVSRYPLIVLSTSSNDL
jgi:hypothetical protein